MKRVVYGVADSEKAWAKQNGLKLTNMKTYQRGARRNSIRDVYQDSQGNLFYINQNSYQGTSREYCWEKGDEAGMQEALANLERYNW